MLIPTVLGSGITALVFVTLLSNDPISIRSVNVPPKVLENGYSGELVGILLRQRIREIASEAATARGEILSVIDHDRSAIEAVAERLQLAGVADAIQELLNMQTYSALGYIVSHEDDLKFGLKVETANDDVFTVYARGGQNIDALIDAVAMQFVERVDPYLMALYWFRKEYPSGEFSRALPLANYSFDLVPVTQKQWPTLLLGRIAHRQGDLAGAIEHYQTALRLDPEFALPVARWGEADIDRGDIESGLEKLQLATEMTYSTASISLKLAQNLQRLGRDHEARDAFVSGLERHPDDPGLQMGLARLYLTYSLYAPALALLEKTAQRHTPDAEMHELITTAVSGVIAELPLPDSLTDYSLANQTGGTEQ